MKAIRCRTVGSRANRTIWRIISLPRSSAGWALPANTNWRAAWSSSSRRPQPVGLGEQQGGPLVGGEAAGESRRQEAGVEDLVGPGRVHSRDAPVEQGRLAACARTKPDQGLAALLAGPPQLVVAGVVDPGPVLGPGLVPGRG